MGNMFVESLSSNPRFFFSVVITVVVSICLHELSHGIVAIWHGDRTPIETGHMTLNPLVHMGGFSLLMLVMAGISWGSMPVNPSRMRGRYAAAWVAAAGPICNLLLAAIALGTLGLWQRFATPQLHLTDLTLNTRYLLYIFGYTNVALAIFNLIPIPPLDGSRILADVIPAFGELLMRLARGGQLTIIFLLLFYFSGSFVFAAAENISVAFLRHVRGYY